MEQLLNIAWVLTVAGIIYATFARPQRAHSQLIAVIVFACVALLLFPVISATDDLHPGSDLSDDAAWRHDKRSLGVQLLALLILISLTPLLVCRYHLLRGFTRTLAGAHPGYLRVNAGRAPPLNF